MLQGYTSAPRWAISLALTNQDNLKEVTMDRKKAVELTRDMWIFLAEDGNRGKDDHPLFQEVYAEMDDLCPLCDYLRNECTECPLTNRHVNCYDDNSPFQIWNNISGRMNGDDTDHNTAGALTIVALCEQELEVLDNV